MQFPPLVTTLSRVRCVAMGGNSSFTTFSSSGVKTVMVVEGHGRGEGCGRGRDSREIVSTGDKDPQQCSHCGRTNHIFDKFWGKFGKVEWARVCNATPPAATSSSTVVSTMQISQSDYDKFLQF